MGFFSQDVPPQKKSFYDSPFFTNLTKGPRQIAGGLNNVYHAIDNYGNALAAPGQNNDGTWGGAANGWWSAGKQTGKGAYNHTVGTGQLSGGLLHTAQSYVPILGALYAGKKIYDWGSQKLKQRRQRKKQQQRKKMMQQLNSGIPGEEQDIYMINGRKKLKTQMQPLQIKQRVYNSKKAGLIIDVQQKMATPDKFSNMYNKGLRAIQVN